MTVWFITGASRGFGLELARQAFDNGDTVVATARTTATLAKEFADRDFQDVEDRLLITELDVTDEARARQVAEHAVSRFGRIDVLVNNAGHGLLGAVEEAADEEVRRVFETNVFGLLAVTRAVLPAMRARRSGHVINLSSLLGFSAKPGWGVYAATKFAVEGLSESLAAELAPLGVRVTLVEPGLFRTDFLDGSSLRRPATVIEDYAETSGRIRTWADGHNHQQAGDPRRAVAAILALGGQQEPPLRVPLGADTVQFFGQKLDAVRADLDRGRELALSMGFPADEADEAAVGAAR
ncbi:oxidoreductase [Kitasatospora sp. NPDC004240]